MKAKRSKIIAIVGTTASGKSDLSVKIARLVNGEVISADSRQVYKGLDIGTGKITLAEMRGVKHHLLDIVDPRKIYTVADYQRDATKAIDDIVSRGKVPIICGGTGFYIDALLKGIVLPEVPPNPSLRARLEKKTAAQLFVILRKLNPVRAKTIDRHNVRRIIRAIEIAEFMKKTGDTNLQSQKNTTAKSTASYDILTIGIMPADNTLKERIVFRLRKRLKQGMLNEAIYLHKKSLSWKRMEALGLEYRFMAHFLKKTSGAKKKDAKTTVAAHVKMVADLETAIWQYARRQKTWFRRDKNIQWNPKNPAALAKVFLKKP